MNEFQRKATVKLLPRIDLQAMAIKYVTNYYSCKFSIVIIILFSYF